MELVKNIFFNTDRLTPYTNIKISYTGKFFQDNSEHVFIHYGFNNEWDNLTEMEMKKTELGYQVEIKLLDKESFNFCFKNDNDEWDNNEGQNFIFLIEKPETSLILMDINELPTRRHLRKSYLWSKKIRLAIYKMLIYIPKIISGNYKKRKNNDI